MQNKAVKLALSSMLALLSGTQLFNAQAAAYGKSSAASRLEIPRATAMEPPPVGIEMPSAVAAPVVVPLTEPASDPQLLDESLQEAARTGNPVHIRLLVRQGAALDAVDESKRTPLILAVIFNQPVAIKQLLALGANRAAKDSEGLTALMHARKLGLPRLARLLGKR